MDASNELNFKTMSELYNWRNILYYTSSCVSSRSWCCFCMCKTVIGGCSCGPKIASPYCVGLGEIKILAMPWAQKLLVMSCQIVWKLN
jgi:hypothetical protein